MKKTANYLLTCVAAAAVLTFTGCSKSKDSLPQIGGYDNSNQVAATNLLAHWTFDNTLNEGISGTAPTAMSKNSFTTGTKGQALALDSGYVLYPTIAALSTATAFPSVTVSLWVKVANNGKSQTNVFGITNSLAAETDWNTGPLNLYVETGNHKVGSDTLQVHADFATWISGTRYNGDNVNNYGGTAGTDYQYVVQAGWFHYIMRYDGSGSNIDLYVNGSVVSDDLFRNRTYGTPAVGFGNINLGVLPTQCIVGGWPTKGTGFTNSPDQGWQNLMTGDVDEIRVYSKALTDAEIGALYQLELAGR